MSIASTHIQRPLHQWIYDTLLNDATLATLIGWTVVVYDNVPDNTSAPYFTAGEINSRPWGTHTWNGFEGDFNVHFWCVAEGRDLTQQVQERVYQLIHRATPSLSSGGREFDCINIECGLQHIEVEGDLRTYHGIQVFNFKFGGN